MENFEGAEVYIPKKLCWAHIDYGDNSCRVSAENRFCSGSVSGDYKCHSNCPTYSRCKHTFELGNFPNRFWDIPEELVNASEDYTSLVTLAAIRRDVIGFVSCGQNLLIRSMMPGTGKTFQACLLANAYIFRRCISNYSSNMAQYVYLPSWIGKFDTYDQLSSDDERRVVFFDTLDKLARADLVIWDGIGFNSQTRLESVIFRSIINERLNNSLSNIFIPYGEIGELSSVIGKTDAARILNSSIDIELSGCCYTELCRDDYSKKLSDTMNKLNNMR